jgi:hypothetical protein
MAFVRPRFGGLVSKSIKNVCSRVAEGVGFALRHSYGTRNRSIGGGTVITEMLTTRRLKKGGLYGLYMRGRFETPALNV